jgi:hypothetical protein
MSLVFMLAAHCTVGLCGDMCNSVKSVVVLSITVGLWWNFRLFLLL